MSLPRRTLLQTAALLTAAGVSGIAATRPGRIPPKAISIQLYTLRSLLDIDVPGTLRQLADIGYRTVETAGTHGLSAAKFRTILDDCGLEASSGHAGLEGGIDSLIEDARTLGHRFLVVPFAEFDTADGWRGFADQLNDAGHKCRAAGLQFGYHNHDHEFTPVDAERPYDILLARTDPAVVHFELDIYWAVHAGQDVLALIDENRDRIRQLHVKDRAEDGGMTDPGTGTIDFPEIFDHARVNEYIVEHDNPTDPLSTARVGYDYLRTARW
ncbi:sugar phosphate isomerase/epimerase [Saccharopolyspora sp. K220]|uniref:sugar phosphate isomerase/epimerase family protein n=1 Tax=Saccharopolyspora soli TaxID=2926618 RepID=UPI001F59C2BE|nr:sugar phosphate isomerase/epimerase [Saccharopolyspora soli]MCI2416911.1 sugar phosphate isomerase/epimerase [Saccharopolyspora soli]